MSSRDFNVCDMNEGVSIDVRGEHLVLEVSHGWGSEHVTLEPNEAREIAWALIALADEAEKK